jgi:predicted small secreted protein
MKLSALILILLLLVSLTACAPGPNTLKGTPTDKNSIAGFWLGLWQGFIAPFVFVISLFVRDLNIYEVHNNGAWYNFGYLFGLMCFFGGGGHKSGRRS